MLKSMYSLFSYSLMADKYVFKTIYSQPKILSKRRRGKFLTRKEMTEKNVWQIIIYLYFSQSCCSNTILIAL